MKTLTTSLTLTALLIAAPALAQTQAQDTPQQTQSRTTERRDMSQQSSSQYSQSEASKNELKVSEEDLHLSVSDANKASKIIGMEVRNMQDERVGKVKDLAIDTRSGRVAYAVISAGGGFFGGGKNVAVPLDALTAQPGEKYFVIDADKDRIASAAGFSDDAWPSLQEGKDATVGLSAATVETEEEREAREERGEQREETLEEQRDRQQRDLERQRERQREQQKRADEPRL
jgi:sporulation protein YlmC with PRC-barrel domain